MLSLSVYFQEHLWMTSIIFDVNLYCEFFFVSKLVNWVIVHKVWENQKFSHLVHMLVGLIMCLLMLENIRHGFSIFTSSCITFVCT